MRKLFITIFILGIMLYAEPKVSQRPGSGPSGDRLEMMKMWKMTEMLELSEEQASKFFPRYNALQKELRGIGVEHRELLIKMKNMIEQNKDITDKELEEIISRGSELEQDKIDKKQEFFESLNQIFTSNQRAKYYGFELWFKDELRQGLKKKGRMDRSEWFKNGERHMQQKAGGVKPPN